MKHLKMFTLFVGETETPGQLISLTEKVVLGSAICIMEGAATSMAFSLPKGLGFYVGCLMMMLTICLAMGRFCTSKLGVDICELYVYEFITWCIATLLFVLGENTSLFWYFSAAFLFLRLIRVYAWGSTTTQQHGWGVFGVISYFYNKKHPAANSAPIQRQMGRAFLMALGMAAIATIISKQLPDKQREALPWAFALIYITINGPILLRALANIVTALFASKKREAELAANVTKLEKANEQFQEPDSAPAAELAELKNAYQSLHPAYRTVAMNFMKALAEAHPIPK